MAIPANARRVRWLLIFAVVAGLIGMHHFLLACSSNDGPVRMPTSTTSSEANAIAAVPAMRADVPPCCDGMLGHDCLAVLIAGLSLLVVLLMALIRRPERPALGARSGAVATPARAPPAAAVPRAELCVWRC